MIYRQQKYFSHCLLKFINNFGEFLVRKTLFLAADNDDLKTMNKEISNKHVVIKIWNTTPELSEVLGKEHNMWL